MCVLFLIISSPLFFTIHPADAVSPSILKYLQHAKQQLCCHVKYKQYPAKGVYNCAGCDAPLYKYDSKFKSGCGWPAFFEEIPGTVVRHTDSTFGMKRTEILCANCGGHLGKLTQLMAIWFCRGNCRLAKGLYIFCSFSRPRLQG